jgi:hypothetical protein
VEAYAEHHRTTAHLAELTAREREILRLVGIGLTNAPDRAAAGAQRGHRQDARVEKMPDDDTVGAARMGAPEIVPVC